MAQFALILLTLLLLPLSLTLSPLSAPTARRPLQMQAMVDETSESEWDNVIPIFEYAMHENPSLMKWYGLNKVSRREIVR